MNNKFQALAAAACLAALNSHAQFASSVISYSPGAGFAAGFTNAGAALGAPASGPSVTPFSPPFSKSQLVSIGAGGEITLQFNSPILNTTADPFGVSFNIFANEFFVSSGGKVSGLFDHAANMLVQVSQDDSTWYTLNPSLAPQAGALFPTDGKGNPLVPVDPSLTLSDFLGQNQSGIESLYAGSAGGTGYDLSWAQDAGGDSVHLANADYVRIEVQSGVLDLDAVSITQAVPENISTVAMLAGVALGLFGFVTLNQRKKLAATVTGAASIIIASAQAGTISENFSTNPLQNGWQVFGDTNLFQWDATNHNVAVTWDSAQPNSYLYRPLETVLTREDNFSIAFDLQINDAAAFGYGFELALGLFNSNEATQPSFNRSTGVNSPDLVEFDYFPDVGYGPTVWPLFVDSASDFNYNGPDDYAIYAPISGDWYHVQMTYTASSQTMVTTMTNFEGTSGVTIFDTPADYMGDFRVNAFSISSYMDDGFGDSVYGQCVIDNVVLTLPPPPVQNLTGSFTNGLWQIHFLAQANWTYALQRTSDFQTWTNVGNATAATEVNLAIPDFTPPADKAFYRVIPTHQ